MRFEPISADKEAIIERLNGGLEKGEDAHRFQRIDQEAKPEIAARLSQPVIVLCMVLYCIVRS
jgi:hypothetical protein